MSDADLAQIMADKEAAAAARDAAAKEMADQQDINVANESNYANFFYEEVGKIKANYSAILAKVYCCSTYPSCIFILAMPSGAI